MFQQYIISFSSSMSTEHSGSVTGQQGIINSYQYVYLTYMFHLDFLVN